MEQLLRLGQVEPVTWNIHLFFPKLVHVFQPPRECPPPSWNRSQGLPKISIEIDFFSWQKLAIIFCFDKFCFPCEKFGLLAGSNIAGGCSVFLPQNDPKSEPKNQDDIDLEPAKKGKNLMMRLSSSRCKRGKKIGKPKKRFFEQHNPDFFSIKMRGLFQFFKFPNFFVDLRARTRNDLN